MAKVTRYESLPIKDLVIERFQVRKQNVGEGLEELADSIEKYGLLQPITVCQSSKEPDKWEIVAGQRRFLAHKQILKMDSIVAGILEGPVALEEGLAISAVENVVRLDMTRKDLIDLCAQLHKKYGTIKDVVEETRLPYHICRKYIRYDGLPADLQREVDDKKINVDMAMKVQDAASTTGSYEKAEAEDLLAALKTVDNPIQKKILDLRIKDPTLELDKIIRNAEKPEETLKLTLLLQPYIANPLREYSMDEDKSESDAAIELMAEGLKTSGYIENED